MTAPINEAEEAKMTSYKDILDRRQLLAPDGKPIWPLPTQDWPSRKEQGK